MLIIWGYNEVIHDLKMVLPMSLGIRMEFVSGDLAATLFTILKRYGNGASLVMNPSMHGLPLQILAMFSESLKVNLILI